MYRLHVLDPCFADDWRVDLVHAGLLDEPLLNSDQLSYRGHTALTRRKRNILFPSGVKLCTQETLDQAIDNHLNYFHLRGTMHVYIYLCWFLLS